MTETAKIATDLAGDKLYQKRARKALPILVDQAKAGTPISYTDIAAELKMANPRNMNFVLGCVGNALIELGNEWGEDIPLLQSLVINQTTGLPGEGIEGFFDGKDYSRLNSQDRRRLVDAISQKVYHFPRWDEVLTALDLKPAKETLNPKWEKKIRGFSGKRGKGEGEAHKALKEYVLNNPQKIGIKATIKYSEAERRLLSGDSIDVYFETMNEVWGVEVKSHRSPKWDIARGLFQCIKYRSVLEAEESLKANPQSVESILVIGSALPSSLRRMANRLGVTVIENCIPH